MPPTHRIVSIIGQSGKSQQLTYIAETIKTEYFNLRRSEWGTDQLAGLYYLHRARS